MAETPRFELGLGALNPEDRVATCCDSSYATSPKFRTKTQTPPLFGGGSVNLICLFSDTYKHTPMPSPREELLDNDDMLIAIILCVRSYLVAVNPYFYIIPRKSRKQLGICKEIFQRLANSSSSGNRCIMASATSCSFGVSVSQ